MNELNGFKIDIWNIHGIKENAKTSICPLCSASRKKKTDKCMSVNWDTGLGTCHHCGEMVQLNTYKKKNVEKKYQKPKGNYTKLSDKAIKWFESRKISQFIINRMKLSEGLEWMPQTKKEENTIQFNYLRDDELINVKYRDGRKNFKMFKDAEKIPYNLDNIRTSKEAIIVEGEMDVLSLMEVGLWNTVSSPNGSTLKSVNLEWLDNSYEYFENKEKIYLALDNDEPGQNVTKELIRRLGAERCYLVDFGSCNDSNEYLVAHGKEKLKQLITEAKLCPLENVHKLSDIKQELHNFYLNGAPKGFITGLKDFDEIFSTYTSQYAVVFGMPTHGKSDFVDQMVVGYNIQYGWKTAFASPENKPTYLHVDKIARKLAGFRPENQVQINSDVWVTTEQHIDNNFFFIDFENGSYDLKRILSKGAELVKRKGIKCLVIDPFVKCKLKESSSKNVNEYTADYLNEIDEFCRKYDIFVILIAHTVKLKKGYGELKLPEPTFYDVKGGGEFFDMSYHGISVYRDFDLKLAKIKVQKCKFQHLGTNNSYCYFKWYGKNGRYCGIRGNPEIATETITASYDDTNWLVNEPEQKKLIDNIPNDPEFWETQTVEPMPF